MSKRISAQRRGKNAKTPVNLPSVPTVRDRLNDVSRAITLAGLAVGFNHDSTALQADQSVHLDPFAVDALRSLLSEAHTETWWLHRLDDELLDQLAPSDDEFSALNASRGVR